MTKSADAALSPLRRPLGDIKGISKELAKKMRSFDMWNIGDLLRVAAGELFTALKGRATWNEVRRWRTIASLLEIEGMDLLTAEALAAGGVLTVRQFSEWTLAEMETLVASLEKRKRGSGPATVAQLVEMVKDAVHLRHTGVLMGTVRNSSKLPVQQATVCIGQYTQKTDHRGRFRLARLPLGQPATLTITHSLFEPMSIGVASIKGNHVTHVRLFTLKKAKSAKRSAANDELSELNGDVLPPLAASSVETRAVDAKKLPEGEILRFVSSNKDRKSATLVSPLLSWRAGIFYVRTVTLPVSDLPRGTSRGSEFLVKSGKLTKTSFSPGKLAAYKRLLQLKRRWRGKSKPSTRMEFETCLKQRFEEMQRIGALSGRFAHVGK
jgi:uncharacterized protein DUF4332